MVPILNRGYDRGSYSAGLVPMIAQFVAGRRGVDAPEAAAWEADLTSLGPDYFFSINRYVFVAVTPERPAA